MSSRDAIPAPMLYRGTPPLRPDILGGSRPDNITSSQNDAGQIHADRLLVGVAGDRLDLAGLGPLPELVAPVHPLHDAALGERLGPAPDGGVG